MYRTLLPSYPAPPFRIFRNTRRRHTRHMGPTFINTLSLSLSLTKRPHKIISSSPTIHHYPPSPKWGLDRLRRRRTGMARLVLLAVLPLLLLFVAGDSYATAAGGGGGGGGRRFDASRAVDVSWRPREIRNPPPRISGGGD